MSTLASRLDALPLTSLHLAAAGLCAIGFGIDLMGISLGSGLSAIFAAPPYSLSARSLSWLLAAVYIGAAIGAPAIGWIADRQGVKRTLMQALLWLGITSLLIGANSNVTWLATFRFLSGLALGAYPPLMIAYLTGIAPSQARGRLIFWACGVAYLAPPLTLFLLRWLTPIKPLGIEGWRWPFAIAGALALVVGLMFKRLPESPGWLAGAQQPTRADAELARFEHSRALRAGFVVGAQNTGVARTSSDAAAPGENATAGRSYKNRLTFLSVLYFLNPWAMSGFVLLTGPMLLQRGFTLSNTLWYVSLGTVGPVVTTLAAGLFVDRLPRRLCIILCCLEMLASIVLFSTTSAAAPLTIAVMAFGMGAALYPAIMTLYGAEIFPSAVRASATSFAWAFNRVASFLMPLILLPLLHSSGPRTVTAILCGALLLSALVTAVWSPGRSVPLKVQITQDDARAAPVTIASRG